MEQKHKEIILELIEEAKKLDRYCMTRKQWREFDLEVTEFLEGADK